MKRFALRMLLVVYCGFLFLLPGCMHDKPAASTVKPSPVPSDSSPPAISTIDAVCKIAAVQFSVERSTIQPSTTLQDLSADDLDFVELVMELEEYFEVLIDDAKAERMLGTEDWRAGMKNVTMSKLAATIDELKQAATPDDNSAQP